jgi:large-conductance mechanosensitive channel
MEAATPPPGEGAPVSDNADGIYMRVVATILTFCHSSTSNFIHRVLLIIDIALAGVYVLSSGQVIPLESALELLVIAHILFYVVPVVFALRHSEAISTWEILPHTASSKHMLQSRETALNRSNRVAIMWAKWSFLAFMTPLILRPIQTQLSDTAPETAELISNLLPMAPIVQQYTITFLVLASLFFVFVFTLVVSMNESWNEKYRTCLSRV